MSNCPDSVAISQTIFPAERIRSAAAVGEETIRACGLVAESPEVAIAVEQHRWAWKPSKIRVVLIAESHVYTSPSDLALHIRAAWLRALAPHAPLPFVRLVYCLGYGENWLLNERPEARNSGTPQYWNIFGRVAGTGRQPVKGAGTNLDRLAWKIKTLRQLQQLGVWLLDASLHGIYAPGALRVPPNLTEQLHRVWWRHYGTWLLDSCPDAYTCVIGSGTAKHLRALGVRVDNWIYQPQAQRSVAPELFDRGWNELLARAVRS
jgi:hypothetical protein